MALFSICVVVLRCSHCDSFLRSPDQAYNIMCIFTLRESDDPKSFCATRANGLVEMVTNAVHEKCRIVNQVGIVSVVKGEFEHRQTVT